MGNNQVKLMYVFLSIIFTASLFLEIYLSRRKDKVSGLILPAIYFLSSLRSLFNLWGLGTGSGGIIYIMLLQNLPTLVLTVIYIICRRKINRDIEIGRMNIQDLE